MTRPLTDRLALIRNRTRVVDNSALFLHELAANEIKDRLTLVNRAFTAPAIVSGFPKFWSDVLPTAAHTEDNDALCLGDTKHDLVVHAMSLHWANDPVGQLIQLRRSLRPDGLLLGIFFGGRSLHELRSALAQAEADLCDGLSPRVAPMGEIRDLGALLQRAGFALPVADVVPVTTSYETPYHLMKDLRAMGEGNAMTARIRHFSRRDVFDRAVEIYKHHHTDETGRVSATFELVFLTGWAPAQGQPEALRPGSASKRLADVLGAQEIPLKD